MSLNKKGLKSVRNWLAISALVLGYLSVIVVIYMTKVKADTIVPGTATADCQLYVNTSSAKTVSVTAHFIPTNGGGKSYTVKRDFSFPSAGMHQVSWKIRKINGGKYKVVMSTGDDFFQPGRYVTLNAEKSNNAGRFMFYDDGTTIAKYKSQWWPQAVAGANGNNGSIGNSSGRNSGQNLDSQQISGLDKTYSDEEILSKNDKIVVPFSFMYPSSLLFSTWENFSPNVYYSHSVELDGSKDQSKFMLNIKDVFSTANWKIENLSDVLNSETEGGLVGGCDEDFHLVGDFEKTPFTLNNRLVVDGLKAEGTCRKKFFSDYEVKLYIGAIPAPGHSGKFISFTLSSRAQDFDSSLKLFNAILSTFEVIR